LKDLFIKYKLVVRFITTFLIVYGIFSLIYRGYLEYSKTSKYYPDYVTNLVAKQTRTLLEALDYRAIVEPHPDEASMKLIINEKYVARIVEGCNSVSIIILFASFIIAFAGDKKTTIFYILVGSVLIYSANLIRVVLLTAGLYHYPWRKDILHNVIFPAIIYCMVFLLWMLWVNRFAKLKGRNE